MAHHAEGDLDEIVTGTGLIQQRAEQDEEEYERRRHTKRDAKHTFGGDPLMVHDLRKRVTLMRDDIRHHRAQDVIDKEDRRNDHQRRPKSAARCL